MGSFWQNYSSAVNNNRASRAEMANAFSRFRAANPHASLPEMQSFIDQMAGGNNYLRGGMPSGQVLQGIAQQNQRAAAYDRMVKSQQLAQQQLQTQNMLSTAAERALIQSNGDLGQASQILQQSLGGNMAGLPVNGLITEDNWNRIQTQMMMDTYPKAKDLLSGMVTDGKAPSTAEMKRMFPNLPDSVLGQMADRAVSDWEASDADRKAKIRSQLTSNNQAMLSQISTIIAGNPDADFNTVKDELINWVGMSDNPEDFPEDIIKGWYDQAKQDYKMQMDKEAALTDAAAKSELANLQQSLMESDFFQTALLNRDDPTKFVQGLMLGMSPEAQALVTPEFIANVSDLTRGYLGVKQDMAYTQASQAAAGAVFDAGQGVLTQNATDTKQALSQMGLSETSAAVWNKLAQTYRMDATAQVAFADAMKDLSKSELGDPNAIMDAAQVAFGMHGVQTLDTAVSTARERAAATAGAKRHVMFEDYIAEERSDIAKQIAKTEEDLSTILADTNPTRRAQHLTQYREALGASAEAAAQLYSSEEALRFQTLDYDSEWDQTVVDGLAREYGTQVLSFMEQIDGYIAAAKDEIAADGEALATEVGAQTTPEGKPLSDEDSPATLFVKGVGDAVSAEWDKIDFNQTWAELNNDLAKENAFSWFRYSEKEFAARKWVRQMMSDPAIKAHFSVMGPDALKEFYKDPISYAKKHSDQTVFKVVLDPESGWPGPAPDFDWTKRSQ